MHEALGDTGQRYSLKPFITIYISHLSTTTGGPPGKPKLHPLAMFQVEVYL